MTREDVYGAGAEGNGYPLTICMPTIRRITRMAYRCALFEAEDVLAATNRVDLIPLEMKSGTWLRDLMWSKLLWHDISKKLIFVNPGITPVRLNRDYDLFLAICQNAPELIYLNAIEDWKQRCRISVCWLDELWSASIPKFRYWLHALNQFDYIFIGCRDSVAALSSALGRPCYWLPGGVDALRFSPLPAPTPERVIDFYSIGRRNEQLHQILLKTACDRKVFYIHDTFNASVGEVYGPGQHREMFAQTIKRSRCFLVAPGKINDPVTAGQVEVGFRFYEGTAGGAILVGQAPDCDAFRELFPWPDAVLPIDLRGSDVMQIFARLEGDKEYSTAISMRNSIEALLRFDWVYRWKELLRVIGLNSSPGMSAREDQLKRMAAAAVDLDIAF